MKICKNIPTDFEIYQIDFNVLPKCIYFLVPKT